MTQKAKQIIIALVVIVVLFIAYKVFWGNKSSQSPIVPSNPTTQFVDGQTIVALLKRLSSVSLDDSIFLNKTFKSLTDFSQPIPDQVAGRPNPFAPIGIDNQATIPPAATSTSKVR